MDLTRVLDDMLSNIDHVISVFEKFLGCRALHKVVKILLKEFLSALDALSFLLWLRYKAQVDFLKIVALIALS